MFYILWLVSAFIAVGVGVFVATRIESRERFNA